MDQHILGLSMFGSKDIRSHFCSQLFKKIRTFNVQNMRTNLNKKCYWYFPQLK